MVYNKTYLTYLSYTKKQHKQGATQTMIIGIDEVGKGAVAGPVAVGCIAFPQKMAQTLKQLPSITETRKNRTLPYRDSKQLSLKQRLNIYNQITNNKLIKYHVAYQTNTNIDKLGIAECTRLAVAEALTQTLKQLSKTTNIKHISIDHMHNINPVLQNTLNNRNINRNININIAKQGDSKFLEAALASIIAKVERDNLMAQLCQKYQGYNLEHCKGYFTQKHREAVGKYGLTPIHRKSANYSKAIKPPTGTQ